MHLWKKSNIYTYVEEDKSHTKIKWHRLTRSLHSISSRKLCRFQVLLTNAGQRRTSRFIVRLETHFSSIPFNTLRNFHFQSIGAYRLSFDSFFSFSFFFLLQCENFINNSNFVRSFSAFHWNCLSIVFFVFRYHR